MDEIKKLVNYLIKCRETYYDGNPMISDEEFDSLENKLYILDKNNEYFTLVGSREDGEKVSHKFPMLSMQKVKNADDAENWVFKMYSRYNNSIPQSEWVCYWEPKIDGVSGTIKYDKDGKIEYMATRGKGLEGVKIPFHQVLINNKVIPSKIPYKSKNGVEIRGEFYLPKGTNSEDSTVLRNITSGLIKRKEVSEETNLLKFIAYNVLLHDGDNEYIEMNLINKYLKEWGFIYFEKKLIHFEDIKKVYINYLNKYRNEWEYITDGLVLTLPFIELYKTIDSDYSSDHHHNFNMALKPPSQYNYTSIKSIEWNVSRHGNLIPVAILDKVNIGNSNITKVALVSAAFIEKKKIGKGSTVKIERANDVIPHILEVAEYPKVKVRIPDKCPICDSDLIREGDNLVCLNQKCKGRVKSEILFWLDTMGMKGIGESTISKIVDKYKIKDIVDFYETVLNRKYEELFSETSSKTKDNIYTIVKNSLKNITSMDLLISLGIQSIGPKVFKKLNIYTKEDLLDFPNKKDKNNLYIVEQIIIKWLSNKFNINKMDKIFNYFNKYIKNTKIQNKDGKNICVTGSFENYSRKDIEKLIEENGDIFTNTVTKNTDYLLNDDNVRLGKYNKALELGIPIITLEKYLQGV